MVRLDEAGFSYTIRGNPLPVLSPLSARFEKGAISAVIGPSGCGKTTLLRVISGLSRPTTGSVAIDGEPLRGVRSKTSVIFQDYGLLPWASVQANAELALRIRGVPAAMRKTLVNPILEELGLSEFSRMYPARLSGGMRQRVAVARALASNPDLLLMDEPFSSLDAITRESLQDTLLETQRRHGMTVVIVTHSIEEAACLADEVFIMEGKNPGRLARRYRTGRREWDAGGSAGIAGTAGTAGVSGIAGAEGGEAAAGYRGSGHYFSTVAALRSAFSAAGAGAGTPGSAAASAELHAAGTARSPDMPASREHAASRPRSGRKLAARLAQLLGAALFVGLAWYAAARLAEKPFLPSPALALARFAENLGDGTLWFHVLASLKRIGLALLAAGPAAWVLGLASGRLPWMDRLFSPLVYLLHPLPKIAFLPILMLFLGLGNPSKIALMGLVVFGQLFVGSRDSAKAISPSLLDTVRSIGGPPISTLRHAIFPATLPALLSSLRISLGTTIAVLFMSETFASMDGLGWYIMDSWSRVDYPDMYAAIMALSLVGLLLYLGIDILERFALRWRESD